MWLFIVPHGFNIISAILTKPKEKGLTVKIKKCKFAQQHAEFLGHVVGDAHLHPQEAKVMAIKDFPVPTTKKQVHRFLGSTVSLFLHCHLRK